MALTKRNPFNDNFHSAYKSNEISTASQGTLIVMLYDGAIRFIQIAIDNMQPSSFDIVNTNLIKAQDIVTELMLSLDMDKGGEIASNLSAIYLYLKRRLLEGNIQKSVEILEEVKKFMGELREAWDEVAKSTQGQKPVNSIRAEGSSFSIEG